MRHVSIVPKPPLAAFVERIWYSSDAPTHQKVRVAPTGTMELVFNLDENELAFYDAERPGIRMGFSGAVFSGAHARPLFVETRAHVIGVHFRPGGAFRFLGIPASELAHTHADVEALWGSTAQHVREQLCLAATPDRRLRILEQALAVRLEHTTRSDRVVWAALEMMMRDAGQTRTRDLAAHLGLSQRHFIKLFSGRVGVTPKQFSRVQRFQRALALTRRSATPVWADIAATCGYFDQSHLVHEFQSLSGLSPTDLHRQCNGPLLVNPPIAA